MDEISEMTLRLDPDTRDLVFDESGNLELVYDTDVIVQNIRNVLSTWTEEFFADDEHGTDYEEILGKNQNEIEEDEIEEIIREAVFQEDEVSSVEDVTYTLDGRKLSVTVVIILSNGEEVVLEVTQ